MQNNRAKIKKPFYQKWWFYVIVVLVVMGGIGSTLKEKEPQQVSSPKSTEAQASSSEPAATSNQDDKKKAEQETKAQKLLDDAKSEFEKANYTKFLEKANKVLSDYPETEVAKTVSVFIKEMQDSAIKISAPDLILAFDENVVKADTNYKDQIVIVTGKLDSIGKSSGVYITIGDGQQYSFSSVQCSFDNEDEINKVAELTKGDNITIIGKCTGKMITNVMLNDCYILEE